MGTLLTIVFTAIIIFFILKNKLLRILDAMKAVEANIIQLTPDREFHIANRFKAYEEFVLALDSFLKLFFLKTKREELISTCLQLMRVRHRIRQDVNNHVQWVTKFSELTFFIETSKVNEKTLFGRMVKSSIPQDDYYALTEKLREVAS